MHRKVCSNGASSHLIGNNLIRQRLEQTFVHFIALAALTSALFTAPKAMARPAIYSEWDTSYPSSNSDDNVLAGTGAVCQVCHQNSTGGNGWNAYGWRVRLGIQSGLTASEAILAAEGWDSDLDPTTSANVAEIFADSQPGWTLGPNNTIFFKNGSTLAAQEPPALIQGDIDPLSPPLVPVPSMGWPGLALLCVGLLLGGRRAFAPQQDRKAP